MPRRFDILRLDFLQKKGVRNDLQRARLVIRLKGIMERRFRMQAFGAVFLYNVFLQNGKNISRLLCGT